ncbi:hypothetical protein B0H10DRAFT_2048253 [Mycena sp. CBHHK59/15]|nr:hypothetical protein B0H10DRAFT_2048253 [Mycena sp. CBHHK59/15]
MDLLPLSPSACATLSIIADGKPTKVNFVLQILSIRNIAPTASDIRYRHILSDGTHYMQSVLASPLNYMFDGGASRKNVVAGIDQVYWGTITSQGTGKKVRIMLVTEMHFIEDRSERIGAPTVFPSD